MDIPAYFRRIRLASARLPTRAFLDDLVQHHTSSIPFENLSVVVEGPPSLDLNAIETKLVRNGRGGYCYEHNSLFQAVLTGLGYKVTGLSARVLYGLPSGTLSPRSHMVLCVDMPDARMLVDVGFGGLTLTAAIDMTTEGEQDTLNEKVRVLSVGPSRLVQAKLGQAWVDVYQFDFAEQLRPDYEQQNWYAATRPNSLFANNLIVTMPIRDGRYALFNRTLTFRTQAGEKQVQGIANADSLRTVLKDVFSIALSNRELERVWEVSGNQRPAHPGFS
jgi:N-hydroxyarylamine O-acetyltransferase